MREPGKELISKATDLGATVAGIVQADELLRRSSHTGFPITRQAGGGDAILVIGLDHPPSRPEMDRFIGKGGTPGNRTLMKISSGLGQWLRDRGIGSKDLPYYVEHGGVFLKDAAALAGLGVFGKNNLLLVPGYGPNIRFRALLVHAPLPSSRKSGESPCDQCRRPCLGVCPERALEGGRFDREACLRQMAKEGAGNLVMDAASIGKKTGVPFCRLCELSCPLSGRQS